MFKMSKESKFSKIKTKLTTLARHGPTNIVLVHDRDNLPVDMFGSFHVLMGNLAYNIAGPTNIILQTKYDSVTLSRDFKKLNFWSKSLQRGWKFNHEMIATSAHSDHCS